MADDIDDLLDQIEKSVSSRADRGFPELNDSVKTDDLKDLLEELGPPLEPLFHSGPLSPPARGKCSTPHLSGTSLPKGMSTNATFRACDQLRCLQCDLAVVVVDGFSWARNTDYLFLRNNYPDLARLRARLDPQRGARAYACQCQHRSLTQTCSVVDDRTLKWVCRGHSQVGT